MSKLSLYTASFPCCFGKLQDYFINQKSMKVLKKRKAYIEILFSTEKVIEELYIDIDGNENILKRLNYSKLIFRIYDSAEKNFIIYNQPRSILDLKNTLSKIFNFEFYIEKKPIDLLNLLDSKITEFDFITKLEIKNALYKDNIFGNHLFYTQSRHIDILKSVKEILRTEKYTLFKAEILFKDFDGEKVTITNDCNLIYKNIDEDEIVNFVYSIF